MSFDHSITLNNPGAESEYCLFLALIITVSLAIKFCFLYLYVVFYHPSYKMISNSILHSLCLLTLKVSLDEMLINVIHYLILEAFQFPFKKLYWFLQLWSCFIRWYEREQSVNTSQLQWWLTWTLNLPQVSSCKMCYDYILWCLTWNKPKNVANSWECAVLTGYHL